MSDYKKPLPVIQPFSEAFWEGTKEGKLLIQHCNSCDSNIFYPRRDCPECWSQDLGWVETGGKGTVYSFTITYEGVEPFFANDLPILLAWVDLPEGARLTTNLRNCKAEDIHIGMEVEVIFEKVTDEVTLPYFKPVGT